MKTEKRARVIRTVERV